MNVSSWGFKSPLRHVRSGTTGAGPSSFFGADLASAVRPAGQAQVSGPERGARKLAASRTAHATRPEAAPISKYSQLNAVFVSV